ncbi:hypothetical protein A6A25_30200 [Saccharothrix sp. CB00851]|nr:hypothetical protein A6A25_30200 [Saccharothrix sp. CB00851]
MVGVVQLMLVLDVTVVAIALPHLGADLDLEREALTWVVSGYTLAFGGLLLLGGRAADVFGARRLVLAGLLLFAAASLLPLLRDRWRAADLRWPESTLTVDTYGRAARLEFADGEPTAVTAVRGAVSPSIDPGTHVAIPPGALLRLVFGHRTLSEVLDDWPDCLLRDRVTEQFLTAAFPRVPVRVWQLTLDAAGIAIPPGVCYGTRYTQRGYTNGGCPVCATPVRRPLPGPVPTRPTGWTSWSRA